MRLYVPKCGDRIVLDAPWTFSLHYECRNFAFAREIGAFGDHLDGMRWPFSNSRAEPVEHTLPAGTLLEIDRVYVRATSKGRRPDDDFDSITFHIVGKRNSRFWSKLEDCCRIEFSTPEVERTWKERNSGKKHVALTADAVRSIVSQRYDAFLTPSSRETLLELHTTRLPREVERIESARAALRARAREHQTFSSQADLEEWVDFACPIGTLSPERFIIDFFRNVWSAKCRTSRLPDGKCMRTFVYADIGDPLLKDLSFAVVSDHAEVLEITVSPVRANA